MSDERLALAAANDVLDMAGRVRADRPVEWIAPLAREYLRLRLQVTSLELRLRAVHAAKSHVVDLRHHVGP